MDTSQFTSELAQFAGVQQQVDTNTNLTSLLALSQGQALLQGSSLLGKQVEMNSTTLPLQNGAASLQFTAPSGRAGADHRDRCQWHHGCKPDGRCRAWGRTSGPGTGRTRTGGRKPNGSYTASVKRGFGKRRDHAAELHHLRHRDRRRRQYRQRGQSSAGHIDGESCGYCVSPAPDAGLCAAIHAA